MKAKYTSNDTILIYSSMLIATGLQILCGGLLVSFSTVITSTEQKREQTVYIDFSRLTKERVSPFSPKSPEEDHLSRVGLHTDRYNNDTFLRSWLPEEAKLPIHLASP